MISYWTSVFRLADDRTRVISSFKCPKMSHEGGQKI